MAMTFSCLTEEEVRRKYREADDKKHIIDVIGELTCATKREVMAFLGLEVQPKRKGKERGSIDIARAIEMYDAGCTDTEIADNLGVTRSAVGIWRRSLGLTANGMPEDTEEERMKLYRMGLNDVEIGEAVGLKSSTIHSWRKRRNLPPNTTRGGDHRKNKEEN